MEQIKVADAKARFSAVLERVERGEEIVIARRGKPIARLIPEKGHRPSAADALKKAWALGGLDIEPISELPAGDDAVAID